MSSKISPCLWFDQQAEQAVRFYQSVFKDSQILETARCGEAGPGKPGSVLTIRFRLNGQEFLALNGGPEFSFTPAISMSIDCADQAEVDYYWDRLLDGGTPVQCGWLTDRYGLSWQVVPAMLPRLLQDPDPQVVRRVMQVMMKMIKLDVAALERARDGLDQSL